jgi:dTDP-4-amino-4,6-dideoxy-D-galactose acyltransferase
VKLIQVYPLDDISRDTLLENNILLADTKVVFQKQNDSFTFGKCTNTSSYNSNDDYNKIEKLALLSGKYSRYNLDRNFINNEFSQLYKEWLANSISKDRIIKGFVTYKLELKSEQIVIGLIAVDGSEQGKGIGKELLQSIENIAISNRIKQIIVATQLQNKRAMQFYLSCGYAIKEQQQIYHLWK